MRGAAAQKGSMTYDWRFKLERLRWDPSLEAGIRVSRLEFEPRSLDLSLETVFWDLDLSLETKLWASQPWDWDWILETGIWALWLGCELWEWALSLETQIWASRQEFQLWRRERKRRRSFSICGSIGPKVKEPQPKRKCWWRDIILSCPIERELSSGSVLVG